MQITLCAPDQLPPPSARPPLDALGAEAVAALHDELVAYHREFAPLFARAEQRHWALKYTEGQLLPLERKSIEPMAEALDGGNVQALQHRPGGTRQPRRVGRRRGAGAAPAARGRDAGRPRDGGADRGWLRLPQARPPLGGRGAAPPRGHPAGRWARWRIARPAWSPPPRGHPASARGSTLVDRRRYVPEDWFTEAYRARRRRCGVPAETTFQTRTALAWAMVAGLRAGGALPFRWVTGDEHFGNTPVLLDQIAAAELAYFMAVPRNVRVWPTRPATAVPAATGRQGAPCTRLRLAPGASAPLRVDALAASLPPSAWQVAQLQDGSTGPLVAEVAFVRAVAVRDGLPGPDVWVVFRRALDATRAVKAYRCNAAADTPPATLVWLLGLRWPIEQAIKEGKEELGLDHYEVRGWRGWHHHTTMTLLAQHFLMRLRCRLGGDSPGADRAPGAAAPERDAPGSVPRCRRDARVHPGHPAPQLCRSALAPHTAAAPAPPPPRHLLNQVTL